MERLQHCWREKGEFKYNICLFIDAHKIDYCVVQLVDESLLVVLDACLHLMSSYKYFGIWKIFFFIFNRYDLQPSKKGSTWVIQVNWSVQTRPIFKQGAWSCLWPYLIKHDPAQVSFGRACKSDQNFHLCLATKHNVPPYYPDFPIQERINCKHQVHQCGNIWMLCHL